MSPDPPLDTGFSVPARTKAPTKLAQRHMPAVTPTSTGGIAVVSDIHVRRQDYLESAAAILANVFSPSSKTTANPCFAAIALMVLLSNNVEPRV